MGAVIMVETYKYYKQSDPKRKEKDIISDISSLIDWL